MTLIQVLSSVFGRERTNDHIRASNFVLGFIFQSQISTMWVTSSFKAMSSICRTYKRLDSYSPKKTLTLQVMISPLSYISIFNSLNEWCEMCFLLVPLAVGLHYFEVVMGRISMKSRILKAHNSQTGEAQPNWSPAFTTLSLTHWPSYLRLSLFPLHRLLLLVGGSLSASYILSLTASRAALADTMLFCPAGLKRVMIFVLGFRYL